VVDGKIYYRENSKMNPIETSITGENRIKGMVEIRECVRQLIEFQTEDYSDEDIRREQTRLNRLYDSFTAKYGLLNSRANSTVFSDDSSYPLLCSLEVLDDEGNLKRKADMFSKRTIRSRADVTHVDTATEALAVSIGEHARVDLGFMSSLMGKPGDIESIIDDLRSVIYKDPDAGDDPYTGWQTADEYLSGNVRKKLAIAKRAAESNPIYAANMEALEAVQPVDLTAAEISVRLGATWLPHDIVEQFVHELLSPPAYLRRSIKVHYMPYNSEWNIEGKNQDRVNVKANATYGTDRANAYKIIEETLNLRDIRVFDAVYDDNGNRTYVLSKKETTIARQKQSLVKQEFIDWIWKDPNRRERLCRLYNDKFNSIRPREYDGRHIQFIGMNPEMALRTHQINAVARVLYGGNTLLAHVVGAGKTFEMVAAAMESKRLGLCQKSMIVVPNHLTEQWAAEFLQLYPAANILVATRKDFETQNRKKFCGRIATGDFDAVVIGHSQFEKIPLSIERQKAILNEQIDTILASIAEAKANRSENFTIKQLEKSRKGLELKLKKLNDQSRKDDVVTFEELGVDRLFIDESHFFKNLFLFTKMRNVAGIAQTEAQKSSDLFAKCRYLDELTGGRGVIFATGTPISNSMVELYTVQRYLQYGVLSREQLENFDAWASNYGETVTAIELSPEGTGYRSKTRFAKFYNLPELMAMFKEVADIQTADMLDLPVPKAIYHNVALKPSDLQREMVAGLSERADKVRNKEVEPNVDNMLLITNDGRKLALDQRLMNPMLPDHENSKASACAENVYMLWKEHVSTRATQLVFCDLSTPKGDGSFNVYDDIRDKLVAKGVPAEEIAYIHDANTETKKKELFGKVRSGQVRVLLGSTFKMGAGTNVQDRLIAIHNLDCPWRPADLEQRAGRIVRQGNQNPEVHIFRYVTEATFDAYLYQIIENKQRFISQVMTSKTPVRSAEDLDEAALSYAEVKALATGNPYIKEKMGLEADMANLRLFKANYLNQRYALEDAVLKTYPMQIRQAESRIAGLKADIDCVAEHPLPTGEKEFVGITVLDTVYTDKSGGGTAILEACKGMSSPDPVRLGTYRGFDLELTFDSYERKYKVTLRGAMSYSVSLGTDVHGNLTRLDNVLESFTDHLGEAERTLENTRQQLINAKAELLRPFAQEEELKTKSARLAELDALLNLEQKEEDVEIVDDAPNEEMEAGIGKARAMVR
jgi:N12 class adenine-specific DNA methylase